MRGMKRRRSLLLSGAAFPDSEGVFQLKRAASSWTKEQLLPGSLGVTSRTIVPLNRFREDAIITMSRRGGGKAERAARGLFYSRLLSPESQKPQTRTTARSVSHRANRHRGFSMIELLIAIVVMGIMMAATVLQMQPLIQQWHANTAMNEVLGQLRWARQASIAERRDIQVQFLGTNEIKLIRQEVPAGQTVLSDLFLSAKAQFMLVPGMPDTPDGFGNASPIEFAGVAGGPPIMQFQSDGTLVDGNGNSINGTVFLSIPNWPNARAITVLGATGRVRAFRSTGKGWVQ